MPKLPRPDLAAITLAGVCVVAITVLAAFRVQYPDVLTYVATVALGIAGGAAYPAAGAASDSTAQRIASSLSNLEQLVTPRSRLAQAAPATRTQTGAPIPAPAPAAATS